MFWIQSWAGFLALVALSVLHDLLYFRYQMSVRGTVGRATYGVACRTSLLGLVALEAVEGLADFATHKPIGCALSFMLTAWFVWLYHRRFGDDEWTTRSSWLKQTFTVKGRLAAEGA